MLHLFRFSSTQSNYLLTHAGQETKPTAVSQQRPSFVLSKPGRFGFARVPLSSRMYFYWFLYINIYIYFIFFSPPDTIRAKQVVGNLHCKSTLCTVVFL